MGNEFHAEALISSQMAVKFLICRNNRLIILFSRDGVPYQQLWNLTNVNDDNQPLILTFRVFKVSQISQIYLFTIWQTIS